MLETSEKLNNQAILLAKDGAFNEAIACFVRAITIDKDNVLLWYNLALTYRDNGDMKNARDCLEHAHKICPDDEETLEELALLCYQMKSFGDALKFCREGLENNPENQNLWNTTGVVYFNQGEYKDACEAFEAAVCLNPYYYEALYNLRDTYKELGNKNGVSECNIRLSEIRKNGEPV